jgi:hypothetical protein
MANIPPGGTGIAPGTATPGSGYPQWGVGGGQPGSSAGWNIVEATDATEQQTYEGQGYLVWFSTQAAAQAYISSESSLAGSGNLPSVPGLAALGWLQDIGHWLGVAVAALTDKYTWISVGWLLLGLLLVVIALYMLGKRTDVLPSAVPVPVPV